MSSDRCAFRHRCQRDGFSLVELLVVVGIIAVLISIMLPVLGKARETANRVKCMSNLRQLAAAFVAYANNNRASFPGDALGNWTVDVPPKSTDWIYFQSGRDINDSVIVPYLARGETLKSICRCPSDLVLPHPDVRPGGTAPLPFDYSYQMNYLLSGDPYLARGSFYNPPKFSGVRHPSDKILLGEADERWLVNGSWLIGTRTMSHNGEGWFPQVPLSIRHDRPPGLADPVPLGIGPPANPDRRGNVAFCDGHVEFVPRSFVAMREHAEPRY